MKRNRGMALVLLLGFLFSCCTTSSVRYSGKVLRLDTGDPVVGAWVAPRSGSGRAVRTSVTGEFSLICDEATDSLYCRASGFVNNAIALTCQGRDSLLIVMLREFDTAYTAEGVVDARMFMQNPRLTHKRLSINEARRRIANLFPGSRIRNGDMVDVGDDQEWYFEVIQGRGVIRVYLDVWTGEIKSVDSDDPILERRLRFMKDSLSDGK